VSFAQLYRGTEYETPAIMVAAAAPIARGRVFMLVALSATFLTSVIVLTGSI